jgi:hypothetical protein
MKALHNLIEGVGNQYESVAQAATWIAREKINYKGPLDEIYKRLNSIK